MTQPPFYVSPEQVMADRADFARAGIARGRSVVVLGYDEGILLVADNPSSRSLNKISEIYDRIAFAGVGKYNEFENLRVAGIRYADLRGYSYDRSDVTARALANAYAQTLGTVFTQDQKPYEVEIVVAEVGHVVADDRIWGVINLEAVEMALMVGAVFAGSGVVIVMLQPSVMLPTLPVRSSTT